jgi:hypothetical protein
VSSLSLSCCCQGPPEKPLLCNACGAHYLVKKSLDGYMPGQRSSSVTPSSSSQHSQQRKRRRSRKPQDKQQLHAHQDISTDVNRNIYAQAEPTGSTTSWMSASSSMEQDGVEVEQPAVVSKKRSRLAACSVYEVGGSRSTKPHSASCLAAKTAAALQLGQQLPTVLACCAETRYPRSTRYPPGIMLVSLQEQKLVVSTAGAIRALSMVVCHG